HARVVIGPALGIGRAVEIADLQDQLAPRRAGHSEVEPLVEVGLMVLGDSEPGARAVGRENFDVAAVERGVDRNVGHLTSIVSPDWPGNPANRASAILRAAAWAEA